MEHLITWIPFAIGTVYMPLGEIINYEPMIITGAVAMALSVLTVMV